MENSMTSMSKANPPKARISSGVDSGEESGWTGYFEDFMCKPFSSNDQSASFSSSSYGTPSLVSDAASLAPKKLAKNTAADRSSKHLKISKKRKSTKVALVDDDLEDTASSPVNSPKVSYLNQHYMNQQVKNNMEISEDKVNTTSGVVDEGNECFLKKKGLCLVPVSMFANFLG